MSREERIDELLKSNNELLERARQAEYELAIAMDTLAKLVSKHYDIVVKAIPTSMEII